MSRLTTGKVALGVCMLALACRPSSRPSPSRGTTAAVSAPQLRDELVRLEAEDQQGRERIPAAITQNDTAFLKGVLRSDSARTRRLKEIVSQNGFPTRSMVGKEGVFAAWLLLQHSVDNNWQGEMLPSLQRASEAGEIPRADVAMLTDRVLVYNGKPQRYGSSFQVKNGKLVPDPVEDLENLDKRRAEVGLMPIAEYVKGLSEMYKVPAVWPPPA